MRYPGKKYQEYVVVYDISSDKERIKVDKILKNFGFRIQKSVFECKLTDSMYRKLVSQLKLLDLQTGFIKIYELTDIIESQTIGKQKPSLEDEDAFFV